MDNCLIELLHVGWIALVSASLNFVFYNSRRGFDLLFRGTF